MSASLDPCISSSVDRDTGRGAVFLRMGLGLLGNQKAHKVMTQASPNISCGAQ